MAVCKTQGDRILRWLLTFATNGGTVKTISPTIRRLVRSGKISFDGNRARLTDKGRRRLAALGYRVDDDERLTTDGR